MAGVNDTQLEYLSPAMTADQQACVKLHSQKACSKGFLANTMVPIETAYQAQSECPVT